jgi:hypothetical protein
LGPSPSFATQSQLRFATSAAAADKSDPPQLIQATLDIATQ